MSKTVKCIDNEYIEDFLDVGEYYKLKNFFRSKYVEVIDKRGENLVATKDRFEFFSPEKDDVEVEFKEGDRVICINADAISLKQNEQYIIKDYDKSTKLVRLHGINWCYFSNRFKLETQENSNTEKKFHSSHYESDTIEPIELISSNKLDFCRASIIKYAFRAGDKKGQEILDIKKIIDYAILLAMQENIDFTKDDAQSIIDYRFEWKEKRGGTNNASN